MEIIVCPKCRIRVGIGDDGTCPSCRASLRDLNEDPSQASLAGRNDCYSAEVLPQQKVAISDAFQRRTATALPPTHFDIVSVCFSLEGRIPRSVYWFFSFGTVAMFYFAFAAMSSLLDKEAPTTLFLVVLLVLLFLWSQLAISVKRFHDLGISGYWSFLLLFPGIGQFLQFFVLGLQRGSHGENRFGRDPLELFAW